ncbi:MAG TPA: hypothetical protein VHN14_04105, partial [Kofleriaceae bacterium]|nr:hypothetical protein [Kofleriaceae bacterium]
MLEARGDQRLAQEANLVDVAPRDQLLDRNVAAELAIVGARHPAEAAAAMLAQDLIAIGVAELGTDHGDSLGRELDGRELAGG